MTVFGPEGPCRARLAPPQQIDTSGCEPSFTTVMRVEGCKGPLAPLALGGPEGSDPAPLRWSPLAENRTRPAPEALPPGPPAELMVQRLAESPGETWARVSGAPNAALLRWFAGTTSERLEAVLLGFQYDFDDCTTFADHHRAAFHVTSGGLPRRWAIPDNLLESRPLTGALLAGNAIVGLVGRTATDAVLYLRGRDGRFTEASSEAFYSDNDECTPYGTAVDFEGPCAP